MTHTAARVGLLALALIALGWLALSLYTLGQAEDGQAIMERARAGEVSRATAERGREQLDRAQILNADIRPRLDEALLLSATGRGREAFAALRRLIADEPDNFETWVVAFLTYRTAGDVRRERAAYRRVRALNPLVGNTLPRPGTG